MPKPKKEDEMPLKEFSKAVLELCGNTEREPGARNRVWITKLQKWYGHILRPSNNHGTGI